MAHRNLVSAKVTEPFYTSNCNYGIVNGNECMAKNLVSFTYE